MTLETNQGIMTIPPPKVLIILVQLI